MQLAIKARFKEATTKKVRVFNFDVSHNETVSRPFKIRVSVVTDDKKLSPRLPEFDVILLSREKTMGSYISM